MKSNRPLPGIPQEVQNKREIRSVRVDRNQEPCGSFLKQAAFGKVLDQATGQAQHGGIVVFCCQGMGSR
jgi:hypothetical protein